MSNTEQAIDAQWDCVARRVSDGLLSIIMPAHNLGRVIEKNIEHVHSVFSGKVPFEILTVNDGSHDNTRDSIETAAARLDNVRLVHLSRNTGKGAALMRGFAESRGSYVLFIDADLDLPPEQVTKLFGVMDRENADVVIGSKRHPDSSLDYPAHRRLMSSIYFALVKLLIGLPVRDTQTGIKLFKRETLDWAASRLLVKRFAFDLELLAVINQKGFTIAESPVILQFHDKFGFFSPSSIKEIVTDTLAIFYRIRLLRYYRSLPETGIPGDQMVSIVIALPGITGHLPDCLAAIENLDYPNYEVILLPDEATGQNWPDKVREVPSGKVRPATKRNMGVEHANGSIIAFIDDDAFPASDWLTRSVADFADDTVVAVGGPSFTPGTDRYMARLGGEVYSNLFVSGPYRYRYAVHRARDVEDFPSCNLLVRADAYRSIGGFRTDFWPGEDTYLCMELIEKTGRRILYDPRVQVQHHRRKLFMPHLRQIARYALHRGYFAKKFPSTSRKLSYMLPSFLTAGIAVGAIASQFSAIVHLLYIIGLMSYLVIILLSSTQLNPVSWFITVVGIVLTHFTYGVGFIAGLLTRTLPGHEEAGAE